MTTAVNNPIISAIVEITKEVGSLAKTGHNTFQNYDYATAADLMFKLQPLLAKHGLVIMQTERETTIRDEGVLAVTYEFSLWHVSGAMHPERSVISGMAAFRNAKGNYDDKAANKCLTAANKYFLINLFKIPTGDYDDADAGEGTAAPKKAAGGPSKAPQGPPKQDRIGHEIAGTAYDAGAVGHELVGRDVQNVVVLPQTKEDWATKIIEIRAYLDSKPSWVDVKDYWTKNVPLFEGLKDKYPVVYKDVHAAFTGMKPKETKDAAGS